MYIDNYTSRCKIFEQIPTGSTVLEIGCGSGRLANILTIKKKCRVYCVDKDPIISSFARGKCLEILNIDIENMELPYEKEAFDCIIIGNTLEHMIEPGQVLISLKKYLKEDGLLIYSVPNIVNWYSRMMIFCGKFEYEDGTVFERNHLRFFTLRSAKKLAIDSGYRIIRLDVTPSIYLCRERLNFLWYGMAKAWKNLFADEFIIIARKPY
ncbi:MAG: class I SAM-dependent methyltransferase [Candidatus Methanoperedens sp.]|nr:class I SAM-dependent methyltransferase [Candidatus Methanoperedens sp.]